MTSTTCKLWRAISSQRSRPISASSGIFTPEAFPAAISSITIRRSSTTLSCAASPTPATRATSPTSFCRLSIPSRLCVRPWSFATSERQVGLEQTLAYRLVVGLLFAAERRRFRPRRFKGQKQREDSAALILDPAAPDTEITLQAIHDLRGHPQPQARSCA